MRSGVLLVAALVPFGCAGLLSYDDYRARGDVDAAIDAPSEIAVDTAPEIVPDTNVVEIPIRPPARPPGAIERSGKGRTLWLVVNHFYLNQQPIGGSGTETPWKAIGYDLDGQCTGETESRENATTCRRVDGADEKVLTDGTRCRDNNFGSQIVPLVSALDPNFEGTSNEAIGRGASTWMMQLDDLDDGPDDPFVTAKLYKVASGGDFTGQPRPRFDGTDLRDIDNQSLIDGDLARPKTVFARGYLAGNVFVSGDPSEFGVTIPIQTVSVSIPLVGGILTLRLNEAHTLGELGILAGAARAVEVEGVLQPIAEQAGFCPGSPLYTNLVRNIQRIMDVADVPGMHDPSVTCNAFSLGFGFTAVSVLPPVRAVPPLPGVSRCSTGDAGEDG
jgi:hypothetical protein